MPYDWRAALHTLPGFLMIVGPAFALAAAFRTPLQRALSVSGRPITGLKSLLPGFRFGVRKTGETGFCGLILEATHCTAGIYMLFEKPPQGRRAPSRTAILPARTAVAQRRLPLA